MVDKGWNILSSSGWGLDADSVEGGSVDDASVALQAVKEKARAWASEEGGQHGLDLGTRARCLVTARRARAVVEGGILEDAGPGAQLPDALNDSIIQVRIYLCLFS